MTLAVVRVVEGRTVVVAGSDLVAPLVAQTAVYRDEAEVSASVAVAAAGPNYPNTAAGLAAVPEGGSFAVDNGDGTVTVYREVGGLAVAQRMLGTTAYNDARYAGITGPFFLNGEQLIITGSGALPAPEPGVAQVQNENASNVGLRVNSFWEGSTGADYVNNDCTLFVVYSDVLSNSANRSWAASLSNAYRNIPAGVTDGGEAVGVIGWASSVAVPGYQHAGTLAAQCGVRGRAGFQGAGSAATAVVQNAVGVDGEIVAESVGATINLAIAGRFTSPGGVGVIEENIAVYANAQNGTVSNYTFYGQNGALFNKDAIVSDEYVGAPKFALSGVDFADNDGTTWHRIWRPDANVGVWLGATENIHGNTVHRFTETGGSGYWAIIDEDGVTSDAYRLASTLFADKDGSTYIRVYCADGDIGLYLGATETIYTNTSHRFAPTGGVGNWATIDADGVKTALYWLGGGKFADADGSAWNRLYDRGGGIAMRLGGGSIIYSSAFHDFRNAAANSTFMTLGAAGAVIRTDTYADNAAAVTAGRAVGTLYKTATGEARFVV